MSTQLAADPETPTRLTADKPGAWDSRTWDAPMAALTAASNGAEDRYTDIGAFNRRHVNLTERSVPGRGDIIFS